MDEPIMNINKEYINCAMYSEKPSGKHECSALKDWYNKHKNTKCIDCPFFKTAEQLKQEELLCMQSGKYGDYNAANEANQKKDMNVGNANSKHKSIRK